MENEDWGIETREVSTAELDNLITRYNEARAEYDAQKAISTDRFNVMESLKMEVIKLLQTAGKTKYEAEGIGKITLVDKLTVTTPKSMDEKVLFFGWIQKKFGDDYLAYLSVNYQTLNSLYNNEIKETGEAIPGLEQPTTTTELRFSKSK